MLGDLDVTQPLHNIDFEVLKRAVEASRSPLIITDNSLPDNQIIYSNQAFLDLTGYGLTEVIGKNCRFLQGVETDKSTVKQLRDAVKNGTYVRVTLKNYRKNGEAFWNDLVMSPVTNAKGKTTHFLGMQLDITERITANEQLQAKSEELERSNHELEQFTYATSHDLQEPLRMINSYIQLLNKRYGDKLDEDALTFLGFATEGAERMQELINDLLSLSKVSSSENRFTQVDISKTVDRALQNLRMSIEESNAQIIVEDLPELSVDASQIAQLFQNLIGNAIKYRRKDATPKIAISAKKRENSYIFSVSDNGIGIPKEHFERVFTIFQRLHTRTEYAGNGIGLSICSKIIDKHDGKIWVESISGKGSTFYFSLPIKREAAQNG